MEVVALGPACGVEVHSVDARELDAAEVAGLTDLLCTRGVVVLRGHDFAKSTSHRTPLHDEYPPVSHPVVRTHPVTGRRALFVNRIFGRSTTKARG